MKAILYTILLFTLVHSSCYLRTIQTCLSDDQCQLVKELCQVRPSKCQDIDATNPNNCSGIQCYYDFKLKSCQPYEDEFEIRSRRVLDHQDNRNDERSESQHQDQDQHNEIPSQNGGFQNQPQNNTQQFPTEPQYNQTTLTNSTQIYPPQTEPNQTDVNNHTQSNQSDYPTNSTSQNITNSSTIVFEVVQFNFDKEKILNSNLEEKDLVISTSFSYRLLASFIIAYLLI